jgi:hypothetical protein
MDPRDKEHDGAGGETRLWGLKANTISYPDKEKLVSLKVGDDVDRLKLGQELHLGRRQRRAETHPPVGVGGRGKNSGARQIPPRSGQASGGFPEVAEAFGPEV